MDRECAAAVKANRVMHDKFSNPFTGPNKTKEPNETGRKKLGKMPWVNWTKDELDLREKAKKEALEIRATLLAQIKTGYPTLWPDPA